MVAFPDKIGRYEILSEIGRGGMGAVFKAKDPVLDRVVALKTMSANVLSEEGMRERFLREARSAARLQHPNIVTIYEFGEVEGAPFIAMELLAGENLADAVDTDMNASGTNLVSDASVSYTPDGEGIVNLTAVKHIGKTFAALS